MRPSVPISIIIPTYNRRDSLINTVNSYLNGKVVPSEIIIVDQTVPALSLDDIITSHQTDMLLLHSDTPSLTRARNIGIKYSKNDIILFSDDDVLVDSNTLSRLYDTMSKDNIALCAGVSSSDQSFQKTNSSHKIIGTLAGMQCFWKSGGYVVRHTMRGRYNINIKKNTYNTDWAMGYFFCVKKHLLNKWSICFDENLIGYAYAEDLDFSMRYCNRAKKENYDCIVSKQIYVKHLATQEWRTPSMKAMYFLVANRIYLLHKNYPQYSLWPMRWNNWCYSHVLPQRERKLFSDIRKICLKNIELLYTGQIEEVYEKLMRKYEGV